MTAEARPVLMSLELAEGIRVLDRVRLIDARTGVVEMTEAELLALGADRVDWGEPDARGYYTPTLYSAPPAPLP